jgi:hypothetical protein
MEFITSTQIRSQFPKALAMLRLGKTIHILHRSKIVGLLNPPNNTSKKIFTQKDSEIVRATAIKFNRPPLTCEEIDRKYRAAMMKKHGQHLS